MRIRYFKSQNVQPTQRDFFQESIVPSVDAVVAAAGGGAEDTMVEFICLLLLVEKSNNNVDRIFNQSNQSSVSRGKEI